MVQDVSNSSKDKGDRAEREAVPVLVELAGDLVDVHKAKRNLGAGRKEDESDLSLFTDVAIQVKFWANLGQSIREAAADVVVQAGNVGKPMGVGMVKIHNVRAGQVRWLACVTDEAHWPTEELAGPVHDFALVSKMVTWLRTDTAPYGFMAYPRERRFARLTSGAQPVLVAPLEAWVAAFRTYREQVASVTRIA